MDFGAAGPYFLYGSRARSLKLDIPMTELSTIGFGQRASPASAWLDAALMGAAVWAAWSRAAAGVGLSLWTTQSDPWARRSRSWYRPPVETAGYLTAWLPALRG